MIFSFYFIGSYFMALRTYQTIPIVIDGLQLIFTKQLCLQNVFAFVRESQIKNISKNQISQDFINFCYDQETNYTDFRRNLPLAFKDVSTLVDEIESERLC